MKKQTTVGNRQELYVDSVFLKAMSGFAFTTAKEVAEMVGCSTSTAKRRLTEMSEEEKPRVMRRKTPSGWVFYLPGQSAK